MPYINQKRRNAIDLDGSQPVSPGELNYKLTKAAHDYLKDHSYKPANYELLNAVYGAMLAAAAEFYRRHVAPYEDRKIEENGDVP